MAVNPCSTMAWALRPTDSGVSSALVSVTIALEGPGIGIGSNPVPEAPAQQFVDGNTQGLALDVPQGLLNPAQGGQLDELAIPEGLLVEGVPDQLDPVGVLADEKVFERLQRPDDDGVVALHGGLPHAGQAHVGVELHEDPVGVASGHVEDFQVGDFHGCLSRDCLTGRENSKITASSSARPPQRGSYSLLGERSRSRGSADGPSPDGWCRDNHRRPRSGTPA